MEQGSVSYTEGRLAKELLEKGVTDFCFKRVPEHYYQEVLDYRRDCLQAASIQHLCKSLIYENPKLPAEHECQDFRHCLVIVQVCCQPCIMMLLRSRSTLLCASIFAQSTTMVCMYKVCSKKQVQNSGPGPNQFLVLYECSDNLLGQCSMLQSCMVKS